MAATNRSKAVHRARMLELDTGYPKEFNTPAYGAMNGARMRRVDKSPVRQSLADKIVVPGEDAFKSAMDERTPAKPYRAKKPKG